MSINSSLRDQLLAAGLAPSRPKAKPAQRTQQQPTKPAPQPPQPQQQQLPAATLAAQRAQAEKFARDHAAARKQQARAKREAQLAAVRAAIDQVALPRIEGEDHFHFVDAGKIKRIAVTPALRAQLQTGEVRIVRGPDRYDLVPAAATDALRGQGATIVAQAPAPTGSESQDGAYGDFIVPDDLRW